MGAIVCGVDGSVGAAAAVRVAAVMSAELGLRLVLAHVSADRAQAAELLARIAADERPGAVVERRVAVGDRVTSLARIAAEEAAAMIVIGSSNHARWRRPLSGFAAELEGTAPCPVLVVPEPRR